MTKLKLLFNALTKFFVGFILISLLLFLPAGTFNYKNAWLFIILLFLPMFILGILLFIKSPELLEKRLDVKEKEKTQKGVVGFSAILFIASFLISAFDFRFSWSKVPLWCVIFASTVLLISYGMYAEVLRENIYLSRTIKVQENQKVIDTGLYGIVRHPMYSATLLLFLAMPLVLGSIYSLVIFLTYPLIIAKRIKGEEEFLEKELEGYREYKQKVRYRLIPFVW